MLRGELVERGRHIIASTVQYTLDHAALSARGSTPTLNFTCTTVLSLLVVIRVSLRCGVRVAIDFLLI
jgi:hypothetical protein